MGFPVSVAHAGDVPLYQPAPDWVGGAPLPDLAKLAPDSPATIAYDMHQRIEDGRVWSYVDATTRIASPEMLSSLSTLTMPWAPDKGDLIVHELAILRGSQRIDLIAQGQKFEVLRREQALEQRELTGILTATLAVEGLQVGDVLRMRISTTLKDQALGGRAQTSVALLAEPAKVGFARLKFSWPTATSPNWKMHADGVTPVTRRNGQFTELQVALPIPKQPEMPDDAPQRYRHPPVVELSTFSDWADVSRVMAQLYATEGTIAPGSPISAEVSTIVKAEQAPLGRAQRALELVQDKIRYLAIGMNGGNYIPQKPARTWEARYGDCKAKTLLLLAILHAMNIEAEPVLANIGLGDFVPNRLPSAGAFNHVLVRATIGGQDYWLDGTGSGSRLADIRDTPPLGSVLPLTNAGSDLVTLPARANARPTIEVSITADESASADVPSVFDASATVRGGIASALTLAKAQLGQKELREAVGQFFISFMGEAQFSAATITTDPIGGTVTMTAHGVTTTPWFRDERRMKRNIARSLDMINFQPDRGRAAWKTIPVATPAPTGTRYSLRVKLPNNGVGYVMEGEAQLKALLGGVQIERSAELANGFVTIEERTDSSGIELPSDQIPSELDKIAIEKSRVPRLIAPDTVLRRWDLDGKDPAGATQIRAADEVFGQAIALDPDEISGYTSRASFRAGIGDRRGAVADLTRAIAIEPSVELFLQRAKAYYELGELAKSTSDAEAARKLDPSSFSANQRLAALKAEAGDLPGAIAFIDERIALGGETKAGYREAKASTLAEFGDSSEAITLYDALVAEKPGSPSLLNARCWAKGTRSLMLESAVKDCTSAIELSSSTVAALDSRGLVFYRLGRLEDALRDYDAVLAEAPGVGASRFMRAVVLKRLGREQEAAKDLIIARHILPNVDKTFSRYGIKP